MSRGNTVLVLMFHHVAPRSNPFWPALDPTLFDELLAFLGESCEVVPLAQLDRLPQGAVPTPRVALSFDDGFQSFVAYAMPLLAKHGFSANQNVIPACVKSGAAPRDMQLYDILAAAPPALLRELRVPGFEFGVDLDDARSTERYGTALGEYIASRSPDRRDECWRPIEELRGRLDSVPETQMMSEHDVREAGATHEIGVHSYSHDRMDSAPLEVFSDDLERCTTYFAEVLRRSADTYAFPYGRGREDEIELLRRRGFRRILLTGERPSSAGADVHPRFTVRGTSRAEIILRSLGHQPLAA